MGFGNRLKKIRQNENLTQEELAKKINTSRSNIANYENDKNMPSIDILINLASVFHCSVDYLVGTKTTENQKEELEKRLYQFNLTEEEYNSAINCFMKGSKKYEALEFGIQYANLSKDKEIEKERQVLLEISEFVSSFIPKNFMNSSNEKISSIKNNNEREKYKNEYYKQLDKYLNEAKIFLLSLDKNKIIHQNPNIENNIFSMTNEIVPIPVYGKISAGIPNWAEECLEGYLPIDPNLMGIINPEECFFLLVNGESMNKVIRNGAYALIRKQDIVENGEIAAVLVNGFEATLKKFSKQNNLIILEPNSDDSSFTTQVYDRNTDIKILGKYIGKFEINK